MKLKNEKFIVIISIFSSILAMALNYGISFLLTPYITKNLGTEAYGFVTLAKTVANYGIIITSCINAYSSRFIIVSYHEHDMKQTDTYYSSVIIANLFLFILFFIGAIYLVSNIEMLFTIPDSLLSDVKILLFLDILNCICLTMGSVFTVSAYVKNKIYLLGLVKIIVYISEAIILFFLFYYFNPKVYYVGIGLLGSTIIYGLLNYFLKLKLIGEVKCKINLFSLKAVKDLLGRGLWSAFNQIGNILNSGLDLWITNLMLNGLKLGQLSIVKTVYSIFAALNSLIVQPFQPKLYKSYAEKDLNQVIKTLKTEMKIMGLIATLLVAGFYSFGEAYFNLWTPGQNFVLLNQITMVTLIGYCFEAIAFPLFDVYSLTLKNTIPCILTVISGLCNVIGMYLLLTYTSLDLFAVVGTTTVLSFFVYIIFTPLYCSYCLKISYKTFYPNIINIFVNVVIIGFLAKFLFSRIVITGWIHLIFMAIITCCIFSPLYLYFQLSRREKKIIINKIFCKDGGIR